MLNLGSFWPSCRQNSMINFGLQNFYRWPASVRPLFFDFGPNFIANLKKDRPVLSAAPGSIDSHFLVASSAADLPLFQIIHCNLAIPSAGWRGHDVSPRSTCF